MAESKLAWQKFIPSFRTLFTASAIIRIGLILYSEWHDARSIVKYTDIDYRVFSDAARFLIHPNAGSGNIANGPLTEWLGLHIGNPYTRETYRYTPLLAVLLLPNELLHPSYGKYLFAACDLLNGVLIYRILVTVILPWFDSRPPSPHPDTDDRKGTSQHVAGPEDDALAAFLAGSHLLNPLVFSISTRGSSESLLCTLVLLTLYFALQRRWDLAAIMLGISTHWKIYPVIYGASCVVAITSRTRWDPKSLLRLWGLVCKKTIRFAILSASTFFALGGLCYAIWGYPFLYEAFLYHAHRLDHRHNFSPYFYLTYLSYPERAASEPRVIPMWHRLIRSPLMSLIPQLSLSIGTGLIFGGRLMDLPFAWFVQTYTFVLFNRVCTSQYFLWYTLFLPLLAPRTRFSWFCCAVWVGMQAMWLAEAYKLEFMGDNVYFSLWLRSLVYFAGHAWVLGRIMQGYATGAM
ncbi:glycosyltransferase family 50 protein [Scleroderma yunnanense]